MGLFKNEDQVWSNIQILFNPVCPARRRTLALEIAEQNKEDICWKTSYFLFSVLTQMGFCVK